MQRRPVIYLDTQDFSRFGDVLRGKSDTPTEALFLELERKAQAGDAIFAASMPIFGELLQYDADYRETTVCKAKAVERLCGSWALAFQSRLIASELREVANRHALLDAAPSPAVLSADRYWYPNVSEVMSDLRIEMRTNAKRIVSELNLPTRFARRKAKRIINSYDPAEGAREAAPEFAAKFGLPVKAVTNSIVEQLRGRITPEEAARRLFSAIAEPVTFVEAYFEKVEVDRSALPGWMRSAGETFEQRFLELRAKIEPFLQHEFVREEMDKILANWTGTLGLGVLGMANEDLAEFGLTSSHLDAIRNIPGVADEVPASHVVGRVVPAYTRQILGLTGKPVKVERSFGGDLVHALYLPHVDLWRGDRRFAEVVRKSVPRYASRIVATPSALLAAIDEWLLNKPLP